MVAFGIQIEDDSVRFEQLAVDLNTKAIKLHNWQMKAIDYFFKHDCTAIFECATGVGKTYFAIEIIKRIQKEHPEVKCLIVCPKNVIMETGWRKELYESGYSIVDIGFYYGMIKEYGKVTITNMQSISKVQLELFDCVVLDEVHNYRTKSMFPIVERKFRYKIGLSATLERQDSGHWDLMEAFDYNVFRYNANDAISEGILNPFKFYNIAVEMDEESMERYEKITQEINLIFLQGGGFNKIMRSKTGIKYKMLSLLNKRKQLVNNYPRKFDVVRLICSKYKDEKTLVFNQFNSQTSKLYWELLDIGIKARIIHSGIRKEERDKNLMDFRNDKYKCLLVSRMMDEGYNLPSISIAIIMAGDSTAKQTIQRMGRVLRKKMDESIIFQIYCKNTIEQDNAFERNKLFKQLASNYFDYTYELNKELVI